MSAELLRRAAALMRERAEAATPGPWSTVSGASNVWRFPDSGPPALVVCGLWREGKGRFRMENADHIASWHPAVALAVADWLDEEAEALAVCGGDAVSSVHALAVARAYLGEPS